jgi:hypothetical protein
MSKDKADRLKRYDYVHVEVEAGVGLSSAGSHRFQERLGKVDNVSWFAGSCRTKWATILSYGLPPRNEHQVMQP